MSACNCASSAVSIHAPAGGATFQRLNLARSVCFNPRARGGRDTFAPPLPRIASFQSTRPRGARQVIGAFQASEIVSIHAPAGGATSPRSSAAGTGCFNPRARGGRDKACAVLRVEKLFQSTRPRGARRPLFGWIHQHFVSIHAPAGGATQTIM